MSIVDIRARFKEIARQLIQEFVPIRKKNISPQTHGLRKT